MKHVSTTITKKFFDMKMQDLERDGFFYEYKEDKPFWKKRLNNLSVPAEIVFLVGNKPHRFMAVYITRVSYIIVPKRYDSAIKTEWAYAIKCVKAVV